MWAWGPGQFVVGNLQRGGKLGNLGWEMPAEENGSEWSLFLASNGHSENKLSNEITETNKEYFHHFSHDFFSKVACTKKKSGAKEIGRARTTGSSGQLHVV